VQLHSNANSNTSKISIVLKKRGKKVEREHYLLRIATTASTNTAIIAMLLRTSGLTGEIVKGPASSINPIEGSCKILPFPKLGYARKTENPLPVGT
jgi:hypothetical protein